MDFINELFQNKLFVSLVYTLAGIILFKIIDLVYKLFHIKKESTIKGTFVKGLFKALVVVFTVIQIASLSNVLSKFANTILMSSSLVVVVIGFIFQEGLSNIVHGTIIALFKPFDIGDRVEVVVAGEKISGYIKSMTLRHTVVLSIIDNAESIIPNSLLDNTTVKNLSKQSSSKRYPLTVSITYEDAQTDDKLKLAKRLFSDAVFENKYTVDVRDDKNEDLFIKVDLAESAVTLTCFINTKTAEDNYIACSEIKEALLEKYHEAGISFAYNHLELTGGLRILEGEEKVMQNKKSSSHNSGKNAGNNSGNNSGKNAGNNAGNNASNNAVNKIDNNAGNGGGNKTESVNAEKQAKSEAKEEKSEKAEKAGSADGVNGNSKKRNNRKRFWKKT